MSKNQGKSSPGDIRKRRTRKKLTTSAERPRLSVFRSNRHMYAQIINDVTSETLVSASTRVKAVRQSLKKTTDQAAAGEVGKLIAKRAIQKKIEKVCFDRGGYAFHGRIKALAEAARKEGLKF